MSDDEKAKTSKVTWGTLAMALFAAVTSVGDGIRSCNEREADRERAARAEADRVKVDTSIQETATKAFDDIYHRIEELEDTVDEQEKELFECRVTNNTQDRLFDAYAGITGEVQDRVLLEALQEVASEEDLAVDVTPEDLQSVDTPPPEVRVEIVAKEVADKKKERRPKPEFQFAAPEPQYEQTQQMLFPGGKK